MSDNPLENATLAKVDKIESGGPYVYICRNGKDKVTFPDPLQMGWDEAERFEQDMTGLPRRVWMPKYLGEKDAERMDKEKLTMGEGIALLRDMQAHYQAMFGDQGEGDASQS